MHRHSLKLLGNRFYQQVLISSLNRFAELVYSVRDISSMLRQSLTSDFFWDLYTSSVVGVFTSRVDFIRECELSETILEEIYAGFPAAWVNFEAATDELFDPENGRFLDIEVELPEKGKALIIVNRASIESFDLPAQIFEGNSILKLCYEPTETLHHASPEIARTA